MSRTEQSVSRRMFLAAAGAAAAGGASLLPSLAAARSHLPGAHARALRGAAHTSESLFKISLAQWSLHRTFRGQQGQADPMDFARIARDTYAIDAIEYVNTFYKDKARDQPTLERLKKSAADHGVTSLLIMCDGEGALGDADSAKRTQAVENHHKWVDAAAFLGCHSIRVNAQSSGEYEEQQKLAADGLRRLCEYADPRNVNVIVENHGGLSSNGRWLLGVMKLVDHPRCGTLPDFGNFCLDWNRQNDPNAWYDRYQGVRELMPFAKAVSAKSNDFNDAGEETSTDYERMIRIVLDAGYRGHIGIEYEGDKLTEEQGIKATKALLERVHEVMREG
jgi:L-ribulose-5-phosphate 3-epimerase